MKTSKAMRLFFFMAMLSILIAPVNGFTDSKTIYDGRLSLKPAKLSPLEESLFREKILPAARASWCDQESDETCIDGSEASALDVAQGSFTRPKSVQKAILYRYSTTGDNMALDGIAVIEGDRVVSHIVYEGGWDNSIGAVPDFNDEGLSKILVASGGTNQGETWAYISIIGLSGSRVTKFGMMKAYSDNCGADERNGSAKVYRLSVKTGHVPVFYQEAFINRGACKGEGEWRKSGTHRQISLERDPIEYELAK